MKSIKKILIASIICTLTIIGTAGLTFSQIPLQEAVPPADTDDVQPQLKVPEQLFNVKVENDLLSVELMDADFGTVINSIAEKAGFKVEMTGDVLSRKITTKFDNIDIERGVLRLLTLIKEKNYMSHYDTKGMLSKLEIYGSGATTMTRPSMPLPVRPQIQRPVFTPPAAPAVTPPKPPVPYVRPIPARPRFQRTPRTLPQQQPQVVKPQTPAPADQSDDEDDVDEEEDDDDDSDDDESDVSSTDIPYIAPQKKQVIIPPAKK